MIIDSQQSTYTGAVVAAPDWVFAPNPLGPDQIVETVFVAGDLQATTINVQSIVDQ